MSMSASRFAGFFSSPARSPNAALIWVAALDNSVVHVRLRLQQPLHLRVVALRGGAHELCAVARHCAEERAQRAPAV